MFNLLNFWYSERLHRQHKFILSIIICVCLMWLSKIAELPKWIVICSLGLGISVHLLRELQQRFLKNQLAFISHILAVLPFIGLLLLYTFLPQDHRLIYVGQIIGFGFLGFVLVSTLQYRAKRH